MNGKRKDSKVKITHIDISNRISGDFPPDADLLIFEGPIEIVHNPDGQVEVSIPVEGEPK